MFGESPGAGDLLINITGESPDAASMGEWADGNRSHGVQFFHLASRQPCRLGLVRGCGMKLFAIGTILSRMEDG
jgi:hypothetical protein